MSGEPERACDCPVAGGMVRHQRQTCTDPVVAQLGWYADTPGAVTTGTRSRRDLSYLAGFADGVHLRAQISEVISYIEWQGFDGGRCGLLNAAWELHSLLMSLCRALGKRGDMRPAVIAALNEVRTDFEISTSRSASAARDKADASDLPPDLGNDPEPGDCAP